MVHFLIGGAPKVGKSETILNTANNLLAKGYKVVEGKVPATGDFKAIFEGINKSGTKVRILINSGSDTPDIIQNLKSFKDKFPACNIFISSVKDENFWPRKSFFEILEIHPLNDYILEIPLAKITRRDNKTDALNWYRNKSDLLITHILSLPPFDL